MINLTKANKNDILLTDSKGADFLCSNGLLVGERNLTVSLLSAERSPFLFGENV